MRRNRFEALDLEAEERGSSQDVAQELQLIREAIAHSEEERARRNTMRELIRPAKQGGKKRRKRKTRTTEGTQGKTTKTTH